MEQKWHLCFTGRPCQERWRLRRVEGTVTPPAIPGWRTGVGPPPTHLPLQFLHPLAATEYHTSHTPLMFLFFPLLYNLNVKCFFPRSIKLSKIKRTKGRFLSCQRSPGGTREQTDPWRAHPSPLPGFPGLLLPHSSICSQL